MPALHEIAAIEKREHVLSRLRRQARDYVRASGAPNEKAALSMAEAGYGEVEIVAVTRACPFLVRKLVKGG